MIHTQYETLSESALQDLFHASNWSRMSAGARLAACQEVANRDAASMGMEPVEVVPEPMSGALYGTYSPNTRQLSINSYVLEHGILVNSDGQAEKAVGANAETLDTIFHENSHAYDHQLRRAVEAQQDGLPCNTGIIAHAQANSIDIDTLRASDSIYVPNGYSYNLQYCEAKAFNAGESKTAEYFEASTARLGADGEYSAYREQLELRDSFGNALSNMESVLGDPHFDKTLNEQICNRYYAEGKSDDEFTYGNPLSRQAASNVIEGYYGPPATDYNGEALAMGEHSALTTTATAQCDGTGNKNSMALSDLYHDSGSEADADGQRNTFADAAIYESSSQLNDELTLSGADAAAPSLGQSDSNFTDLSSSSGSSGSGDTDSSSSSGSSGSGDTDSSSSSGSDDDSDADGDAM